MLAHERRAAVAILRYQDDAATLDAAIDFKGDQPTYSAWRRCLLRT